ncbi:class I SAM-dependent methyltransferase [Actinospongicola halichondriae]|uniref:class I SAM-dependent methyltransferase n=1 Tax=Actinospongicola halichondriae TaxID=3236844 RepID=UPI003D3C4B9C
MSVADALLHLAAGDTNAAVVECGRVERSSPLAAHLARHLVGPASTAVYVDPAAFERFISGGSNVDLYAQTIQVLAELNERRRPASLLDIGCGDGRITAAVLPTSCERIHLLEPSTAMLEKAVARVARVVDDVRTTRAGFEDLFTDRPHDVWDAVQSTFALHTLPPQECIDSLRKLARRTRSLAVVEFDVPAFNDRSPGHADYAAAAYEAGVAEYEHDQLVIDGFLLPVLVGQFAPERQRHTHERPARAWVDELRRAGFTSVTTTHVATYWWANAVLIHGASDAPSVRGELEETEVAGEQLHRAMQRFGDHGEVVFESGLDVVVDPEPPHPDSSPRS